MLRIREVCEFLDDFAPAVLAEEWDNVGLLVGDADRGVQRVMTCLTITPETVAEAVSDAAQLIVSHHPIPFRPIKRLTTDSTVGKLLWQLAGSGISVYSPHTAFDSCSHGINQHLAEGIGLSGIRPLVPSSAFGDSSLGGGRIGTTEDGTKLADLIARSKEFLHLEGLKYVGSLERPIRRVAVACGAAGEFLGPARHESCDVLILGETSFHTCLEAESTGTALILAGHFASERFAVELLADRLRDEFALQLKEVWSSRRERDPLCWA